MLPVTALAFSPDGKTLLAGTGYSVRGSPRKGGEVKLFDLPACRSHPSRAGRQWENAAELTDHGGS